MAPEMGYIPPAMFTKINYMQEYGFEENPLAKGDTMKSSWVPLLLRKIENPEPVPDKAPDGADAPSYFERVKLTQAVEEEVLLKKMIELFEERPMWLRPSLERRLDPGLRVTWWLQRAFLEDIIH